MDIVSLPIELDKEKQMDSRFRLVVIASQRARELAFGAKIKIDSKHKKFATLAIEEALENKLEFITGEEAKAANEEARKFDYKRFLEEKRRDMMAEDISELEKDLRMYLTEREGAEGRSLEELFSESEEKSDDEAEK